MYFLMFGMFAVVCSVLRRVLYLFRMMRKNLFWKFWILFICVFAAQI